MTRGIVVLGASAGGTNAVAALTGGLPRGFPLPVVAALHHGSDSTETLAECLQKSSILPVREAQDKDAIVPGRLYLAPAGYHLLVEKDCLALSMEGPVHWARPSIDVLFESAADTWGARTIGVILTGNGCDGAQGLARIKKLGGLAVVQDPAGAEYPAMPQAAIAATRVDQVLPLQEIAPFLAGLSGL